MKPTLQWSGKIFNNCEILKPVDNALIKCIDWWWVKCYCGNIFKSTAHSLTKQAVKSCKICANKRTSERSKIYNKKDYYTKDFVNKYGVKILRPVNEKLNRISDKWFLLCPGCGNEFIGLPRHVVDNTLQSCKCLMHISSGKFFKKLHQENRIRQGFNKNQYMTGWSMLIRRMIFHPIVNLVLELDGHTCCLCNTSFEKLDVHHIIPFKTNLNIKDFNTFKYVYDIDNLITLCRECHKFLAHNGHGSKIDLKIQEKLFNIIANRKKFKNILDQYNIIVKNNIEPWIKEYIAKQTNVLL